MWMLDIHGMFMQSLFEMTRSCSEWNEMSFSLFCLISYKSTRFRATWTHLRCHCVGCRRSSAIELWPLALTANLLLFFPFYISRCGSLTGHAICSWSDIDLVDHDTILKKKKKYLFGFVFRFQRAKTEHICVFIVDAWTSLALYYSRLWYTCVMRERRKSHGTSFFPYWNDW